MLQLFYGNAVSGNQRFKRPALEKRLMTKLRQGGGVRMFGLRRIGKSTLRNYVIEQLQAEGRVVAYIDGQGLHSLGDLLSRLFQAMPQKRNFSDRVIGALAVGPIRIAVEAISKGGEFDQAAIPAYWQILSDAIRRSLQEDGAKPVLVIDEFTYVVSNMVKQGNAGDVDRLLASMREWRDGGMTMLLTGSIGLTSLARRHGINLEHVNDLQPFDVPELTEAEARAFIDEATSSVKQSQWTQAHTDELIHQVGTFYPCFLVRGMLELGIADPPSPNKFGEIFEDEVRPDVHNEFVRQFDRRFAEYEELPNDERELLIVPALAAIMATTDSCPHDAIPCPPGVNQRQLGLMLDMLIEDGFIRFSQKNDGTRHWRAASSLSRMWWAGRNWS